jgi:hypothetical protein
MATAKLIGIFSVRVSQAEWRWVTENVTGDPKQTEVELGSLALLEVEIRESTADFDVGLFHQADSDQVAWLERYFTSDGLNYLGDTRPEISNFRVCFFLHYFDPERVIVSPYGILQPMAGTEMPKRLSSICVYEHPG